MRFADWILAAGWFIFCGVRQDFVNRFIGISFLGAWLLNANLPPAARAQAAYLDQTGVTALRSITTNLNGAGICVGQPEANLNGTNFPIAFEIDPVAAGQAAGLIRYHSSLGSTNVYPNLVGTNSWHAEAVARFFFGLPNGVATNLAQVNNYNAEDYVFLDLDTNGPGPVWICSLPGAQLADRIVNQSFIFGQVPGQVPLGAARAIDAAYDDFALTNGTFFVSGAGNGGGVCPPSTCFNGISVGAFGGATSIGPTFDQGRCKPDICAPAGVTSESTPQAAGAAALLLQAALRGDGGNDTNAAADFRTIKALLLNGAVKPVNWTNSNVFPLDARYGAGVLNVLNAYKQLTGGRHAPGATNAIALNGDHPPSSVTNTMPVNQAWDFSIIISSATNDTVAHYLFEVTNVAATATLVWNRQFGQTNLAQLVNDLDLYLYRSGETNPVARSDSYVNNVEHLWATNLSAGRYDLQVVKYGGTNIVSSDETYALAWEFVPPPVLAASRSGTNVALTWPVYPAGFAAETRTNLLAGVWSTNGLGPVTFTNGLNRISVDVSNAARFFRLRQPGF